ncbi:hypothetical protein [Blautia sp.]|nr:hypothetical protein [Blautia sp.]
MVQKLCPLEEDTDNICIKGEKDEYFPAAERKNAKWIVARK